MLLVEHILPAARRRLITVEDDAPVLRSADPHVSLVIVCDAGGVVVGVISKADIVRQMSCCEGHACKIETASVMTRNIVACASRDWLSDVWQMMKNVGVRQTPILDDASKPVGIVYAIDALHALLKEAQDAEQLLRDYVTCIGFH